MSLPPYSRRIRSVSSIRHFAFWSASDPFSSLWSSFHWISVQVGRREIWSIDLRTSLSRNVEERQYGHECENGETSQSTKIGENALGWDGGCWRYWSRRDLCYVWSGVLQWRYVQWFAKWWRLFNGLFFHSSSCVIKLTDNDWNIRQTSMFVPEPVISLAIRPKGQETPNFSRALNRFQKEDPTFRVHVDGESQEVCRVTYSWNISEFNL